MKLPSEPRIGWTRLFPPFSWLSGYRMAWLPSDTVAGVTLAAYAIPVSLAYAGTYTLEADRVTHQQNPHSAFPVGAGSSFSQGQGIRTVVAQGAPPEHDRSPMAVTAAVTPIDLRQPCARRTLIVGSIPHVRLLWNEV